MNRFLLLLLLPTLFAACARDPILVFPDRLAPGGGGAGEDGTAVYATPVLNIVVRMRFDATSFNPQDLMRLEVDGVDRAEEMTLGGLYGILTLDPPPPPGTQLFTTVARRIENPGDAFTYVTAAYTGPTLTDATPRQGAVGTPVTITGTGFSAAPLRVFFGSVEATVAQSTDTTITTSVPNEPLPGLIWVLVGNEAAEGIVDFQPLDATGAPIPFPTNQFIFAAFPASGVTETPVRFFGVNFDNTYVSKFNAEGYGRVIVPEVVTLPNVGNVLAAWAVPVPETPAGAGEFSIELGTFGSNRLPWVVEATQ